MSLEWRDAGSVVGWVLDNEAEGLVKIRSIGILFSETDEALIITTSINEHFQATDPLSIPKAWLLSRTEIGTLTI